MYKLVSLVVLGCVLAMLGQTNAAKGETVGEHFEKAMKRLEENCSKAKLRSGETGCDPLKLKPADPDTCRIVRSVTKYGYLNIVTL